jgi:hypothetical protein
MATSEDGRAHAEELIELVDELSEGLGREEAQRRVAALWAEVEQTGQSGAHLSEKLKARGEQLQASKLGKPVGKALTEGRLKDAGEALRTLAERLEDNKRPPSKRELEELREAIAQAQKEKEKAREESDKDSPHGEAARRQLTEKRDRLLQKKQAGKASAQELQELEQAERQLKTLDRRKREEEKTLSDLDRALADAARELQAMREKVRGKDGKSGQPTQKRDSFDQAANSMEKQSSRSLTEEEKKELLRQLKRLKERLRQAEKNGDLQKRLEEFERQARGKRPGRGGSPGATQPGAPTSPPMQIDVPGGSQTETKVASGPSKEPGAGHDPDLIGKPGERLEAETKSTQAAAQDTGEGESESETIRTAAEEGFTRATYEQIYTEYKTVAEEMMDEESIPAGQKRSIQRYFELIRPRETAKP